ncbi:MAG TPA: DUF934 domain-containing protein [Caulobacteraceae bacterium]|jgi:uncharacterized protein (DUF934 family)
MPKLPKLIEWRRGRAAPAADAFVFIADDEEVPAGDVIVSLTRFHAEGERLIGEGRQVGVRVAAGEDVESLAYDLPAIALVALEFPKFKDGRSYSAARILRERFGYQGQVRAVGDVLLEQASFMIRCGFDAFAPADGTGAKDWTAAAARYRHVYQRAADDREPAFALRSAAFAPSTTLWSPSPVNGGGSIADLPLRSGGRAGEAGRGAANSGEPVQGEAA